MDTDDNITAQTSKKQPTSIPFLIYVFGVGLSSIAILFYWGFTQYSFFIAVGIGGVIQLLFRIIKRMWLNALTPESNQSASKANPLLQGFIETLPNSKVFLMLYAVMVCVSALWYGVGRFFGWLVS